MGGRRLGGRWKPASGRGADLVGVEETGVGGQSAGDLLEEIGGEGRPAAGSHKERVFL